MEKQKIAIVIYNGQPHTRDNISHYRDSLTGGKLQEVPEGYKIVYDEPKEKIKQCPFCKAQIEELNFDVTGTCSSSLTIEEANKNKHCYEVYDSDSLMQSVEFDNFSCPECGEVIFYNEDYAKSFLKGE